MPGRHRLALYRFEWFALLATAGVVLYLRGSGLRVGWRAFALTVPPMLEALPRVLAYGVLVQVAIAALRGGVRDYLRRFLRFDSLALWLRVCLSFVLVTFAYSWLKVSVPLLNRRMWDDEIWRFDRWLHFGVAPNVFARELFGGTIVAPLLDRWYALWLLTVLITWSWAAVQLDATKRRNFALACGIFWIGGAIGYLALPVLGPCYAVPELFQDAAPEAPRAAAAQAALGANYAKMIAGRDGSLRQFNPYLGVAAMPSLHVGAHWLFALWSRRNARSMRWPWSAATLATFIGSLFTGWHYAVDGYAGMLLAWGAVALADRWERVGAESGAPDDPPLAVAPAAAAIEPTSPAAAPPA